VSRASLPLVALAGTLTDADVFTPPVLVPTLLALAALPAAAAWLIERAARGFVLVDDRHLVLGRKDLRLEVPRASIAGMAPWWLPLPGPGVTFTLRSGAPLAERLEIRDPLALCEALGETPASAHPVAVWAQARAALPPWHWYHLAWKFVLFALAPTAVLFNAHQHIAYGGALGQYYLEGPGAFARTFALYWLAVSLDLVLWAAVWRTLAEGVALVMALVAPSHAARVRRAVEVACRVLYYAGAPGLVAARFLA
jgi:apolipoprotein N-acyltransferase